MSATNRVTKKIVRILVFEEPTIDMYVLVDEMPKRGTDTMGRDFFSIPGGALNISIMLARLGLDVQILAYIGNDHFEKIIRSSIQREGINDVTLKTVDGKTTVCMTFVDKEGERTFITIPGVGKKITKSAIESVDLSKFNYLFLSGYSFSKPEITEATLYLFERAKAIGLPIIFDPGTAVYYAPKDLLLNVAKNAYFVFLNSEELRTLTGLDTITLAGRELVGSTNKLVVVKLGSEGCAVITRDFAKFYPAYEIDNVVDTTGAGDAFNAAFTYGYLKTKNVDIAANFANLVGAISTTKMGAGPNLPTLKDILKEIKKRNIKIILPLLEFDLIE